MARPRETNISKWGKWKRQQRDGSAASTCSRCGKAISGRNRVQHHPSGVMNSSAKTTLCRSCHAVVDNPMYQAAKDRINARTATK